MSNGRNNKGACSLAAAGVGGQELKRLLSGTPFISVLSDQELDSLASTLERVHFRLGQVVYNEGDQGDSFDIVYSGRARVVTKAEDGKELSLGILSPGDHFGEQALLTGEPRQTTVRAAGDLILLRLYKDNFDQLLKNHSDLQHYFSSYISDLALRNFIKQCTVFSPLQPSEMRSFLDAFEPFEVEEGHVIVREGDAGDAFYLIREGQVKVAKGSLEGPPLSLLSDGDFFGELALLTDGPRAASVIALSPTRLFKLSKGDFLRIIEDIPQVKDAILGVAAGYSSDVRDMLQTSQVLPATGTEDVQSFPAPKRTVQATASPALEEGEATSRETATADVPSVEPEFEEIKGLRRRKWRLPVLLQQSEMDCGATCLAMIAAYYGVRISINRLREMTNVTREGATMHSLAEAAEDLGFRTRGIRGGDDALSELTGPAIAYWQGYHYVVVYRVLDEQIVVADPAEGLKRMSREEFNKGWSGALLTLAPTPSLLDVERSKSTFSRFLPFVTAHKRALGEVFIASLLIQLFGLAVPVFTQNIVDRVLVQQNTELLNILLVGMVVVALLQAGTTYLRQFMLVRTVKQIDGSLLVQFFSHVLGLPLKYFEDRRVGDIVSRINENAKIRELLTGTTLSAIMDVVTVAVYLTLMLTYSVKLGLFAVAFIPLISLVTLIFTPVMKRNSRRVFQAGAETQSYVVEAVSGMNTVKAMAAERPVRWTWEEKMRRHLDLQQSGAMIATGAQSTGQVLQTLSTAFILWYGARLVMGGEMTIGQLMAFNVLLGTVIGPILRVVNLWDSFQEARVALERLNDVFESPLEQSPGKDAFRMPPIQGRVTFENVTFRYHEEGNNVLQNIDLDIPPHHTVALVGRSGSGKTTLINLLLRLYQPTEGSILIDGVNIKHVSPASLRQQIGVVLQDNFLFSGTIRENIALGSPDATMQDVITASMLAGAHEFISELPYGYETVIGERGMTLSGGQRQRLAIARALVSKPQILILDEATSALDTESEKIIQQNLEKILHDRTTFIIAHRLSTVRNADLILVLDRGVIVEKGTHYELMEKKGLYFYLNSQQLQSG